MSTRAYITNIYGNDVAVLDLAERKVIATIPVDEAPNGISFTPLTPTQPSPTTIELSMPEHNDTDTHSTEH